MAAATAWEVHHKAKEKMAKADIDFDTAAFQVLLCTSAETVGNDPAENDASTLTNELGTANGYTIGGEATTPTVSESAGTTTVDFTDATWNATGAGITARYAVLIYTTTTPDEIIAHTVLDGTPADVTAANGNQFKVQFHANGAFQIV
jgi:hypothetical protein